MWHCLSSVAVEQTFLLYMLALGVSDHAWFNLMFQKSCDNSHSGPSYLGKHCPQEEDAETETAKLSTYKAMLHATCVCLVLMYAGAWSDSRGKQRKPLIIAPILGQILTDGCNLMLRYYWSTPSYWVAINTGLLPAVTGGKLLLMTGCMCYISDTTSFKTRTFRIGILGSLGYLATPFGVALSGKLMVQYDFFVTFGLCIVLNLLALLIAWLLIPDTSMEPNARYEHTGFTRQILDNFSVLFRRRPNSSRLIVILCVVTSPLVRSPMVGEYSVLYLFVRYKFGWNETDYGYYAAFKLGGIFFGTVFSMGILSKSCGMSDSMIGILASISDMAAAMCYIFVTSSWQMFAVPMLDIFHGAAQVVCSSIVSKHVDPHELGKVASTKAFLDSFTPFLVTPLYNKVYIHTFQTLPSAFFIISVVFGLPILIIFCIIRRCDQKMKAESSDCRENYNNFNNNINNNEHKVQELSANTTSDEQLQEIGIQTISS